MQLVVWTASGKSYADVILDLLDPTDSLFVKRLYRDSCVQHRGLMVKDLRRLGRPMNTVVLLDNYVYSFGLNLNNGVPISPWTGIEVLYWQCVSSRCVALFAAQYSAAWSSTM